MPTSEAITHGIRITVHSRYAPEHFDHRKPMWFFVYTITITNEGRDVVQLLNRHWIITDANGEVEEVRGPGVVGHQPILASGESFEYTSGCPLGTPFGSMHGTYEMSHGDGETFLVEIAPFALRAPSSLN